MRSSAAGVTSTISLDIQREETGGGGGSEDIGRERAAVDDGRRDVETQASEEAGSAPDAGTTGVLWGTGADGRDGS